MENTVLCDSMFIPCETSKLSDGKWKAVCPCLSLSEIGDRMEEAIYNLKESIVSLFKQGIEGKYVSSLLRNFVYGVSPPAYLRKLVQDYYANEGSVTREIYKFHTEIPISSLSLQLVSGKKGSENV